MPGLTPEQEAAERNAMSGFPEDEGVFEEAVDPPAPPAPPAPAPPPPPDPMVDIRARMDALERESANLKRMIPPPKPTPTLVEDQDEFDKVDWDKEMFANPTATIKKAMTMTEARVEKRLRAEYQKESGTQKFWSKFYDMHPDLKDDHDLVEVTLNSNLGSLANIPVDEAYGKLAELTRQRILRYAGGAARTRSQKARAEGGGGTPASQAPPPPKPDDGNVTTLSDLIQARRNRRRRAGAA